MAAASATNGEKRHDDKYRKKLTKIHGVGQIPWSFSGGKKYNIILKIKPEKVFHMKYG
jgi:hypothetical protein